MIRLMAPLVLVGLTPLAALAQQPRRDERGGRERLEAFEARLRELHKSLARIQERLGGAQAPPRRSERRETPLRRPALRREPQRDEFHGIVRKLFERLKECERRLRTLEKPSRKGAWDRRKAPRGERPGRRGRRP